MMKTREIIWAISLRLFGVLFSVEEYICFRISVSVVPVADLEEPEALEEPWSCLSVLESDDPAIES